METQGDAEAVDGRGGASGGRPLPPEIYMTSTDAQNSFGRLMDTVARGGTVLVTRHNATQAVVMSVERYEALTQRGPSELDTLAAEFDELLARMQMPHARAGLRDAFGASPKELGRAAVEAAGRHPK